MRVLRFLFRNWPLKLGALVLAIILYVGMVALQNAQAWPGQVAIEPSNQPTNAVLLTNPLPKVGHIRFVAPPEVTVTKDSFTASVDLSQVKLGDTKTTQFVRVSLSANDNRIQILDFDPQQIQVTLDPVVHRTVAVKVDWTKPLPAGLTIPDTPQVSIDQVDAFGPSSLVRLVAAARAWVVIDASGLDVDQTVDLQPVDSNGNEVTNVEFNPPSIRVKMQVGSQLRTSTVPVNPVVVGTPAPGYFLWSVDVKPSVVEVRGEADALAQVSGRVSTKPVSIAGANADVTTQVGLDLPTGVEAVGVSAITVTVHVQSPSTTRTFSIAIAPDGARSDRVYILSVNTLSVTFGGSTANLDSLDTSTLFATVSVGDLDVGQHQVTVKIPPQPGLKIVNQSLNQINVTVEPAPTPSPPPSQSPAPPASPSPAPS